MNAVKGCTSLTSLTIPFVGNAYENATKTYFGWIFGTNSAANHARELPESLKTATVLNDVAIDTEAFYGCKYLRLTAKRLTERVNKRFTNAIRYKT